MSESAERLPATPERGTFARLRWIVPAAFLAVVAWLLWHEVGEFPLPARSPGQVFWLQPRFVNSSGKEQWGRAIAFSPDGPPVKRDAVVL